MTEARITKRTVDGLKARQRNTSLGMPTLPALASGCAPRGRRATSCNTGRVQGARRRPAS